MKIKPILIFALILLLIIRPLALVLAQDAPYLPPEMKNLENLKKTFDDLQDLEKRNYLMQEWRNIILNNKVLGPANKFLEQNNASQTVFLILFGEKYTISFRIWFIMFFWLFLAIGIAQLVRWTFNRMDTASYFIGFGAAIVLAQVKAYTSITNFLSNLIFAQESWWARTMITLAILFTLAILIYFEDYINKWLKEKKIDAIVKAEQHGNKGAVTQKALKTWYTYFKKPQQNDYSI